MLQHADEKLFGEAGVFWWEAEISPDNFFLSPSAEYHTGYSNDNIDTLEKYLELCLPSSREEIQAGYSHALSNSGKTISHKFDIISRTGKVLSISETIKYEETREGIKRLTGVCTITSQKEFRAGWLPDSHFLLIATLDCKNLTVLNANTGFINNTVGDFEKIRGKNLRELGFYSDTLTSNLSKKIMPGSYFIEPALKLKKDGGSTLALYSIFELFNINESSYFHFFAVDPSFISIISNTTNDFFKILENSPSTIVVTNRNAEIEYVNPKFTKLTDYRYEEVIGKKANLLKSGYQSKEFYDKLWHSLLTDGFWEGEFNNIKKDGSCFWESAKISTIKNNSGEIIRFIKFGEDITEKKHSELSLKIENKISSKLNYFDSLEGKISWIIEVVLKYIELDFGAVFLQNSSEHLYPAANKNFSQQNITILEDYLSHPDVAEVIRFGKPIFNTNKDIAVLVETPNVINEIRAFIFIPYLNGGSLDGVIVLASDKFIFVHDDTREILLKILPFVVQSIMLAKEQDTAKKTQLDLSLAFSSVEAGTWVYNIPEDKLELKSIANWEQILGYTQSDFPEISLDTWISLVHPDDKLKCINQFRHSLANNCDYILEYRMKHGSGKWIWISGHGKITRYSADNMPLEMHGIIIDISSVKENESKLKEAQSIARLGNWEYDILNDKLSWSEEVFNIFEIPAGSENINMSKFTEIVHPDDREMVDEAYNDSIRMGKPYDIRHRVLLKSGHVKYVNEKCHTEYDSEGIPVRSVGIVIDITDLEISKQKLEESEQKFRLLAENTSDGLFVFEAGEITYMSPSYKKMMGYGNSPQAEKIDILSIIHPEDLENVSQKIYGSIAHRKTSVIYQYRALHTDGHYIWREDSAKFLYDERGLYKRAHVIARNITRQKEAERKIIETNLEKTAILNAIPDMMFIFSRNGDIVGYHASNSEDLYKVPEIFLNSKVSDVLPESLAALTLSKIDTVLKTRSIEVYSYKLVINGAERNFESRMVYIDPERTMAMVRDITQNVKLTAELIKAKEDAEKSEILKSEFLAQMSHEIRTPVGAIMSYSQILREYIQSESHEVASIYEGIERSGKRIIRTINLILNTSEIETGSYDYQPVEIDLKKNIFDPLYAEFKYLAELKNLYFEMDIPENIPIIVDEYSFMQIFGNLIDNALKYTERGFVRVSAAIVNTDDLEITVEDSGIGISQKYIPQIFKAFTQEESGYSRKFEGTGLGLKLVKEYCRLNSAGIKVESTKGKGTSFIVTIKTASLD